jgi:hypothetical protein
LKGISKNRANLLVFGTCGVVILAASLVNLFLPEMFLIASRVKYGNPVTFSDYTIPVAWDEEIERGSNSVSLTAAPGVFRTTALGHTGSSTSFFIRARNRPFDPEKDLAFLEKYHQLIGGTWKHTVIDIAGVKTHCYEAAGGTIVDCTPESTGLTVLFIGSRQRLPSFYSLLEKIERKKN